MAGESPQYSSQSPGTQPPSSDEGSFVPQNARKQTKDVQQENSAPTASTSGSTEVPASQPQAGQEAPITGRTSTRTHILSGIRTFHGDVAAAQGEEGGGEFVYPSERKQQSVDASTGKKQEGTHPGKEGTSRGKQSVSQDSAIVRDPNLFPEHARRVADTVGTERDFEKVKNAKKKRESENAQKGSQQTPKEQPKFQSELDKPAPESVVRTYEDDTARRLKDTGASVTQVMLSEKKRREEQEQQNRSRKKEDKKQTWMVAAAVVFIFLSITAFFGYWAFDRGLFAAIFPSTSPAAIEKEPVFFDGQYLLDVSEVSQHAFEDLLRESYEEISQEGLVQVRVGEYVLDEEREQVFEELAARDFFSRLSITAPAYFTRALLGDMYLAYYGSEEVSGSALILPLSSFENAFAGMLNWEGAMLREIGFLFTEEDARVNNSSIVMSSEEVATSTLVRSNMRYVSEFADHIVNNRDVRVYYSQNGLPFFLYAFPFTKTLVIADSPKVLTEVMERLERRSLVDGVAGR